VAVARRLFWIIKNASAEIKVKQTEVSYVIKLVRQKLESFR
jgi:hypothetical protein